MLSITRLSQQTTTRTRSNLASYFEVIFGGNYRTFLLALLKHKKVLVGYLRVLGVVKGQTASSADR